MLSRLPIGVYVSNMRAMCRYNYATGFITRLTIWFNVVDVVSILGTTNVPAVPTSDTACVYLHVYSIYRDLVWHAIRDHPIMNVW